MNSTYIRQLKSLLNDANDIETDNQDGVLVKITLNQQHINTLKLFDSNGLSICTDVLLANKTRISLNKLTVNTDVILNLSPHYMRTELGFAFYFTFDAFLDKNNTRLEQNKYFILDKNIFETDSSNNELIKTYNVILELQHIFNDIANDIEDDIKYKIYTFFDSKKIKINSTYTLEDIEYIINNCPNFGINVKKLYDDLELKSQKQLRIIFFKKALEATFKNKEIIMSDVLRNLNNIFEEYEAHYRAYINSLEPEKIKYEFEEEHNGFLKELNTILGDVHNKIIFIPLAFIFGASQLTNGAILKSSMIITGMIIFSGFISLFLDTHSKVLKIINNNIKDKKHNYEQEDPSLYEKFKSKIENLQELSKSITIRMTITRYSNWFLTLIVVLIFYFLYS